MNNPLISVITVCRNAARTLPATIDSVKAQRYPFLEHCIIDGASSDHTLDILKQHQHLRWISEPDNGIYDAMNKGLAMARGEIIGFLNADDVFAHEGVLQAVAEVLSDKEVGACFADLEFRDERGRILRRYNSGRFHPRRLAWGWMPAHPTLYVRREWYQQIGGYRTDYQIAADYEFVVRLFACARCPYRYVPDVWVYMRPGGISTRGWRSSWILNKEIVRACRENGISTSFFRLMAKLPLKLAEKWIK